MQRYNQPNSISVIRKTGISVIILLALIVLRGHSQVGIKNDNPDSSSELHIGTYGTDKGLLIPYLDSIKIVDTEDIGESLMFYVSREKAFMFWDSLEWQVINPFTAEMTSDTIYTQKSVVAVKEDLTEGYKYQVDSGGKRGIPTVPIGGVLMWSGHPDQLPANYQLCNGAGTYYEPITGRDIDIPDLRGRFVVGYNGATGHDYEHIGNTGPAASPAIIEGGKYVKITENTMPDHDHDHQAHGHTHDNTLQMGEFNDFSNGSHVGAEAESTDERILVAPYLCTDNCNMDPLRHTHSLKGGVAKQGMNADMTESTGGGQAHENRPPYYVLAYIIRKW